jgi:NADP-reducing hydrogenase subunit HndD
MIKLTVNNVPVSVEKDSTVLAAAAKAGIKIPTLCHLDGVSSPGSCRVCLVEVKGMRTLQPSCVTKVSEGMEVSTNTKLARDARKLSVELMLANHPWDCNACSRNNDCELQSLAKSMGITEVRFPYEKEKMPLDNSTPALVRDMNKCVLCRRCIGVCQDVQGVGSLSPRLRGFDTVIGAGSGDNLCEAICVQCGQCSAVCPVGAIYEKDSIKDVWKELDNPDKYVIVQTAPAIRAALGECFGLKPGTLVTGKMVTALRRLGFKKVFDTNFTADLTIIEEGTELLTRLKTALIEKGEVSLPMFTSCSPGWINYMEYFHPNLLPNLSTCKSPQQMFGALAKTYFAEKAGIDPSKIVVVSVMPCTAKKFECDREEMKSSGFKDVDYVLTTRELGRMITEAGIEFSNLEDGEQDAPMGMSTGAADIFANTGGVMEAALRTVYEIVTGKPLPMAKLHIKPVQGLKGLKETAVTLTECKPEWSFLEGVTAKVAVAHGLSNAKKACDLVAAGNKHGWHFIEVMCCPGGCIGGGGQPRLTTDAIRKARIKAIYKEDEGRPMRKSHDNPAITQIYKEFLHEPLGHKSHELLHTHYRSKAK